MGYKYDEANAMFNGEERESSFIEGTCKHVCRIIKAEEKTSKAGNKMLVVSLEAENGDFGQVRFNFENKVGKSILDRFVGVLLLDKEPQSIEEVIEMIPGKRVSVVFEEDGQFVNPRGFFTAGTNKTLFEYKKDFEPKVYVRLIEELGLDKVTDDDDEDELPF